MNRVRQDPHSLIPIFEEMLKSWIVKDDDSPGYDMKRPGMDPVPMKEGPEVVKEALEFVKKLKPLQPMVWRNDLVEAGKIHADDVGPKGTPSHFGSDGSVPPTRIAKVWKGNPDMGGAAENIYLAVDDPALVIQNFIIDDGDKGRGHRINILSSDLFFCGIYSGEIEYYDIITVWSFVSDKTAYFTL